MVFLVLINDGLFFQLVLSQQKEGGLKSGLLMEVLASLFHICQMTTVEERKVSGSTCSTLPGIATQRNL